MTLRRARPWTLLGWGCLLLLAALVLYGPALHGVFLWDDLAHVPARPDVYTPAGLRRIWTLPGYVQQYYPLTFTTLWLAHRAVGDNPFPYHLLTLLFHVLNGFLLGYLLSELAVPAAAWAALLFVVHPVHVESVAWISEIKNTQSAFFSLAALCLYWRFLESSTRRRWGFYALSSAAFGAAILSKTVACALPGVILILLWWKRGLVTAREAAPLFPWVAAGLALAFRTAGYERTLIGAMGPEWDFSWSQRLAIAGRAVWFYAGKLFWPHPLMFIYPRWVLARGDGAGLAGAATLLFFLALLWQGRGRLGRGPLAAVLIFLVVIAPALGFVNVYPMRYSFVADHFQYAASIALIALAAAGLRRLLPAPRIASALLALVAVGFIALGHGYAQVFRSPESLWRDVLAKNPGCGMARVNLAILLAGKGDRTEARRQSAEALRMNPHDMNALLTEGDFVERFDRDPERAVALFRAAYRQAERLPVQHASQGLLMEIHGFLGQALYEAKRYGESEKEYEAALAAAPPLMKQPFFDTTPVLMRALVTSFSARLAYVTVRRAEALRSAGRLEAAAEAYEKALRLDPSQPKAQAALAGILARQGRVDEAIQRYREALELDPEDAASHERLGALLLKEHRTAEAAQAFAAAERDRPRAPVGASR